MAALLLKQDLCKSWEKNGQSSFLDLYKELSKADESNVKSSKTCDRLMYELFQHVIKGTLKPSQAVLAVKELVESEKMAYMDAVAVLCIIDAETKFNQESNQRKIFLGLLKDLQSVLPLSIVKEQLDADTMEEINMVKADEFNKKFVKVKTKIYYKQQKFNLLREESEGYSKLITELSQEPNASLTASDILTNVKALIGCFNLDPNRVLDIMLQVFESRIELADDLFVPLLTQYMPEYDSISQILGFHIKSLANSNSSEHVKSLAPIFNVISVLMKHELLTLDNIYPHLSPSDAEIKETYKKTLTDARSTAKRSRAVHTGEKKEGEGDNPDSAASVPQEPENQKLSLVESLLRQGVWTYAKDIMDRLPQYHVTSHEPVARTMCQLIHYVIDPLYRENHGLPAKVFRGKPYTLPSSSANLRQAQSFVDLVDLAFPMLRYLGCHISVDPTIATKIIRIIKAFISQRVTGSSTHCGPEGDLVYRHCLAIMDEVILPSLCLSEANCCLAEQIWSILQLLPFQLRYQLYGQWKSQTYYTQPELIAARLETMKKAKHIFSRLTKENVKQQGRLIGKLSHANPAVFFEYMFTQVQVYDNLIAPIVDALKYLNPLSFDVLAYCLIEALAAPDKEKMKYDDTNLSTWLKSLASFTGLLLKKYQVEFTGILQYVCNQLKAEKSFDLLILREMLSKMGGIEVSEEVTDQQLEAMCGGELLKQEGGNFIQARNVKKPSQRLKDAILKQNLATPLCLLMAQQRDCIVYNESVNAEHIKLIGKVYDQCQDTYVQLVSFLSSQLSTDEFSKKLPSLEDMLSVYHIPSDAAFYLIRPMIFNSINSKFELLRRQDRQAKEKDKAASVPDKSQRFVEAVSTIINPICERIRPLYDQRMWEELSPQLFVTFWTLQAYDLSVPKEAYDREVSSLKAKKQQLEQDGSRDMREAKKKKEAERFDQMMSKLKEEEKKQADHVTRITAWLDHDKSQWFKSSDMPKQVERFIQFCIFPRILNTTVDAFYCAKMIHTMHKMKVPNFGTLIILDRIFNDITYLITCCTENEAHRYGKFLCCILEIVMRWRSSEDIYKKECSDHPGFITTFRAGAAGTNHAELSFEDFRHVCHKWQFRMTKAAISCFESGNYTQIRNALIVFTKLLPYYPMIVGVGQALERRVDKVYKEEKDKRPDLYALAMGYAGQLKTRKSSWLAEQDFHYVAPEKLKKKQDEAKAKQAAAAAAKAKSEAAKSDSVEVVKVVKPEAKSSANQNGAASSDVSAKSSSNSSSSAKSVSKDRAEAAAFLKEASKIRKEDGVELPPAKLTKTEPPKLEIKQEKQSPTKAPVNAAVNSSNGSSTPKPTHKVTKVKESKVKVNEDTGGRDSPAIVKIVKTEKKDRLKEADGTKSANSSPKVTSSDERETKKRKIEALEEKSSTPAGRDKRSPAVIKSPTHSDLAKPEKKEKERSSSKEARKRSSEQSSDREDGVKKRRSDVAKNGNSDTPDNKPSKRTKEDLTAGAGREKERKSDKHRSSSSSRKAE